MAGRTAFGGSFLSSFKPFLAPYIQHTSICCNRTPLRAMMPVVLPQIDTTRPMSAASHPCGMPRKRLSDDLGLLTPPVSPMPPVPTQAPVKQEHRGGRVGISEPVSWIKFKQLVDARNLEPLGRSLETQAVYERHMAEMKRQYGSVANYLTTHALGDFIATTKEQGFDPTSPIATDDFLFRANDFPYYLGDGVQHWVLWCRKRLTPGFDAPPAAIEAIRGRFGQGVEWRYFVNPVAKQSVPQLSHAHVFVKPSTTDSSC